LETSFKSDHAAEITVEQLRPPLRPRFSRLPGFRDSTFPRNADRLLNRFHDYPSWLRRRAGNFDLFHIVDHSYAQLALDLPEGSVVVTCHDLDTFRCLLEPDRENRPGWFRAMTRRILRGFSRAAHVISPSASTKAQLLEHGLFPDERVTVIPPGTDPVFGTPLDAASVAEAKGIAGGAGPYLLHVGSAIRRKRVDVLLRVFSRVRKQLPEVRLVRVGGAFTPEQARLADELGVAGSIQQAAYVSKTTLAALYREAAILLQPSDAEGFGLPVIEAMACGCPVLASDIPPLREAGGSAAGYCPAGDVEAWSATLVKLLAERQTEPVRWEARRQDSERHAAQFTWRENANRTLAIYQKLLVQGPGRRVI
jgi:glycosyltransferase involved in cell wall biosynthesis